MDWAKIMAGIGALLVVWVSYRMFRANPSSFSRKDFSKSFATMGWLALGLIGFIAFCVLLLKGIY